MREPDNEKLELRNKYFDRVEWEAMVIDAASSRRLFLIWDEVCRRCESNPSLISRVERKEMWDLIKPRIKEVARMERQLEKAMMRKVKSQESAEKAA